MARGNDANSDKKAGQVSQRLLSPGDGLVEAACAQVRQRRSALHSIHFRIERTRAHGVGQPLDRIVGFTRIICTKPPRNHPAARLGLSSIALSIRAMPPSRSPEAAW